MILAGGIVLVAFAQLTIAAGIAGAFGIGTDIAVKLTKDGESKEKWFNGSFPTVTQVRMEFSAAGLAICDKNGQELLGDKIVDSQILKNYSSKFNHAKGTIETSFVDIRNLSTGEEFSFTACPKSTWKDLFDRLEWGGLKFDRQKMPVGKLNDIIPDRYLSGKRVTIDLFELDAVKLNLSYVNKDKKATSVYVGINRHGGTLSSVQNALAKIVPSEANNIPLCNKAGHPIKDTFFLGDLVEKEDKAEYWSHSTGLDVHCPNENGPKTLNVCLKTEFSDVVKSIQALCAIPGDIKIELTDAKTGPITNENFKIVDNAKDRPVIKVTTDKPVIYESVSEAADKDTAKKGWELSLPGFPNFKVRPNLVFLGACIFLVLLGGGLHYATKDNKNQKFKMPV